MTSATGTGAEVNSRPQATAGRPVLAVDLGGTHMRAALVAPGGTLLRRRVEPTPRQATCPDALLGLVAQMLEASEVSQAVVGLPGRVDYATCRLEHAPNLPEHWPAALTRERLEPVLKVPVALANDADLAAAGEAHFGAGRHHRDVVFFTLSTGVGAGVVLGGRLVHGRRSLADAGHTIIDWQALSRGEPASLEELASGSALARLGAEAGLVRDGRELVSLAAAHHPDARAVFDRVVRAAATGVVNLAYLYSPEVIIVGGGLGLVGSLLLDPMRAHLARYGPPGLSVEVARAALGDDAGLAGAAAWQAALCGEEVLDA